MLTDKKSGVSVNGSAVEDHCSRDVWCVAHRPYLKICLFNLGGHGICVLVQS